MPRDKYVNGSGSVYVHVANYDDVVILANHCTGHMVSVTKELFDDIYRPYRAKYTVEIEVEEENLFLQGADSVEQLIQHRLQSHNLNVLDITKRGDNAFEPPRRAETTRCFSAEERTASFNETRHSRTEG